MAGPPLRCSGDGAAARGASPAPPRPRAGQGQSPGAELHVLRLAAAPGAAAALLGRPPPGLSTGPAAASLRTCCGCCWEGAALAAAPRVRLPVPCWRPTLPPSARTSASTAKTVLSNSPWLSQPASVEGVEAALVQLGLYDLKNLAFTSWRDDWRCVVSGPFTQNLWKEYPADDAGDDNQHGLWLCFGCHAASLWGPSEHATLAWGTKVNLPLQPCPNQSQTGSARTWGMAVRSLLFEFICRWE